MYKNLHILKVAILRESYVNGDTILFKNKDGEWEGNAELIKRIGKVNTKGGEVDLNQYSIGRVQYLLENRLNIEQGDLVIHLRANLSGVRGILQKELLWIYYSNN